MKTILLGMMAFLFSLNSQAQNKNVTETTKTTVTTVKTSEGDKKFVKKENVREVQNIELKQENPNSLNIEMKETPVVSTTKITGSEGIIRTVEKDKSSNYFFNGTKYTLVSDPYGYTMTYGKKKPAILRKTATNSYFYKLRGKTAIGYFDPNGNLVLESYDKRSDKMIAETYVVVKE